MSLNQIINQTVSGLYLLVSHNLKQVPVKIPNVTIKTVGNYVPVIQELQKTFHKKTEAIPDQVEVLAKELTLLAEAGHEVQQKLKSSGTTKQNEVTALSGLDFLYLAEMKFKAAVKRTTQLFFNLPATVEVILAENPELTQLSEFFKSSELITSLKTVQHDLDEYRRLIYRDTIHENLSTLYELVDINTPVANAALRQIVIGQFTGNLEKRTLFHMAALTGDVGLTKTLIDISARIGLDIYEIDGYEFSAYQYGMAHERMNVEALFLSQIQKHEKLKDKTGRTLADTLRRINNMSDLTHLENVHYGQIAFHTYVHSFFQIDKLIEKMKWLRNIDLTFRTVSFLQDHADTDIRQLACAYVTAHQRALPVRAELARIVGFQMQEACSLDHATWCISQDEYQELMEQSLLSDSPSSAYVNCLDMIQQQFTELQSLIQPIKKSKSEPKSQQELGSLTAIIQLELACIQGVVIHLLRENIIDRYYRVFTPERLPEWEKEWQKNKMRAIIQMQDESRKDALSALYNLLETTLGKIEVLDNLDKLRTVYFEPLLYATNPNNMAVHLQKIESDGLLIPREISQRWRGQQLNLQLVLSEVSSQDREEIHFGRLFTKYQIKLQLQQLLKQDKKAIVNLCYQALVAPTPDAAQPIVDQIESAFHPIPGFLNTVADGILLLVKTYKQYERKAAFQHFEPIAGPQVAAITAKL